MTEQEKAISQFCIALQSYCNELREELNVGESYEDYLLACIEHCIEQIHRMVNPEFKKICEDVEEVMEDNNNGGTRQ